MNGIVLKRGLKSKSEDNVSIDEKEKETWKRVKLNEVIHSFTRLKGKCMTLDVIEKSAIVSIQHAPLIYAL